MQGGVHALVEVKIDQELVIGQSRADIGVFLDLVQREQFVEKRHLIHQTGEVGRMGRSAVSAGTQLPG